MHKEIKDNRKIELSDIDELLDQPINVGDIIGISDNANPITWDYYYVKDVSLHDDMKTLTLSRSPNGIVELTLQNHDEGVYYIHIPMQEVRDTWIPNRELTLEQVIDQVFKLSYAEVHWTTRTLESICEEIPSEIATREEICHHMDANPRQFRRTRDGKYEYLVLTHPELAQPEIRNRRGVVQPARNREPLELNRGVGRHLR
jgi:hypothetical protein